MQYLQGFYSSQKGYLPSIEENLRSYETQPQLWNDAANWILHKIRCHLPEQVKPRLLDVGCAYGFFLLFAKAQGFDVHGIEVSAETSKYAIKHGIDVQNSTLADADLIENSFSIVTMNNVLEHTLDPVFELEKAFRVLGPSGILYIGVPNWESIVARFDRSSWKMISWPNHLFYFTTTTLTRMLQKVGFVIQETLTHMGESDFRSDVRVVRNRLGLNNEEDIRNIIECLWTMGQGPELVIIARKPESV